MAYGYTDIATWNNLAGALFNVSSDGGVLGQINSQNLVFNNLNGARFAKIAGTNSVLDSEVMNNLGDFGLRQRHADLQHRGEFATGRQVHRRGRSMRSLVA